MLLSTLTFLVFFMLPAAFPCTPCPPAAGSACGGGGHGSSDPSSYGSGSASVPSPIHHLSYVQYACPSGEYSRMASLLHSGHEGLIKHLYVRHEEADDVPLSELAILLVIYFLLATTMLGIALPHGSFIPGMILGSLGGRLAGEILYRFNVIAYDERGVYALVGSASVLGGMTRMSITLSAVLVEVTGDVGAMSIIMLALAVSSAVASMLSEENLDEILIHITGLPYLHEEPPKILEDLLAQDVMSPRVETLQQFCSVRAIIATLDKNTHNGFPVEHGDNRALSGLIYRRQLMVLLHERAWEVSTNERRGAAGFGQSAGDSRRAVLRERYVSSHSYDLKSTALQLSEADLDRNIDLSPYVDPSPSLVFGISPLPHVYHLFNKMGVRHVIVIDSELHIVGMITRKDTFPELVERRLVANFATHLMCSTRRCSAQLASSPGQLSLPNPLGMTSPNIRQNKAKVGRWQGALGQIMGHQKPDEQKGTLTVTYATVLAESSDGEELHASILRVLSASLKNNPDTAISGMLYYDLDTRGVVHVLEGCEDSVRTLYSTILADARHLGCEVLREHFTSSTQQPTSGLSLTTESTQVSSVAGTLRKSVMGGGASSDGSDGLLRLQCSSRLNGSSPADAQSILAKLTSYYLHHITQEGIGGLLSYDPSSMRVLQVLEGPVHAVRSLYHDRIVRDEGHIDCKVTAETPLANDSEREFTTWGLVQEKHSESDEKGLLVPAESGPAFAASMRGKSRIARLQPAFDEKAAAAAMKRIADAAEMRHRIESKSERKMGALQRRGRLAARLGRNLSGSLGSGRDSGGERSSGNAMANMTMPGRRRKNMAVAPASAADNEEEEFEIESTKTMDDESGM